MQISREEAKRLAPDYVAWIEGNPKKTTLILDTFATLRQGHEVITYFSGSFYRAKVTSINHASIRAIDGPVVRVGTEEGTWRVDGDRYAFPIST